MNSRKLGRALETERTYTDGQQILQQGDVGMEMFIIREGAVRITRQVGEQRVELNFLERGEFFGEMGLLESEPRDADAWAVGSTRLLVIGSGGLLARLRRDPSFALEMIQRLSRRIRALNDQIGV